MKIAKKIMSFIRSKIRKIMGFIIMVNISEELIMKVSLERETFSTEPPIAMERHQFMTPIIVMIMMLLANIVHCIFTGSYSDFPTIGVLVIAVMLLITTFFDIMSARRYDQIRGWWRKRMDEQLTCMAMDTLDRLRYYTPVDTDQLHKALELFDEGSHKIS